MGVNRDLVEQRLVLIADAIRHLGQISGADRSAFPNESYRAAATESYLRRALEAVFDVGRHLLAKSGRTDLAAEYKSIAKGLVEIGAVSPRLGETLAKMAGYRNRLVHLYDEVTEAELDLMATTDLGNLEEFIRSIRGYLQTRA